MGRLPRPISRFRVLEGTKKVRQVVLKYSKLYTLVLSVVVFTTVLGVGNT